MHWRQTLDQQTIIWLESQCTDELLPVPCLTDQHRPTTRTDHRLQSVSRSGTAIRFLIVLDLRGWPRIQLDCPINNMAVSHILASNGCSMDLLTRRVVCDALISRALVSDRTTWHGQTWPEWHDTVGRESCTQLIGAVLCNERI